MSEIVTYYQSTHPVALEFYAECQRRIDEFQAKCAALKQEFPGYELITESSRTRRQVIALSGEAPPGEHWKQRSYGWVPNCRRVVGKKLDSHLREALFQFPEVPATPGFVFVDLTMKSPGFEMIDGVAWLKWGASPEDVEASSSHDPVVWTRAKASEYHLAREAKEAEGNVDA